MRRRRVVITGMGAITPLGHDVEELWRRLLAGDSGVGPVTRFDARTFSTNFGAEVRGFDLREHVPDAPDRADVSVSTGFALAAAEQAVRQARLAPGAIEPRRFGMYLGAGEGSLDFDNFVAANLGGWDEAARTVDTVRWAEGALSKLIGVRELEQEPNMPLCHLGSRFGCRGPSMNCMTACAASTQAVGEAYEIIKRGDADAMLTGGAHSMIHPLGMTGFIRLTAMSTRRDSPQTAARPFDSTRDGFVMGEGAGILVLEALDSALARGVKPLAEIVGFGSTADAFRITDIQSEGEGALRAMGAALREAGISPVERGADGRPPVHYVSAHGTGTQENDSIETLAVKRLFGSLAPEVPFSSVKSMLGHLIQAAGAVELITCIKAIETGFIPPTMNLNSPDPECDLDYVPNAARDLNPAGGVDVCLSNSFGFGGQNDTVCVRRYRA